MLPAKLQYKTFLLLADIFAFPVFLLLSNEQMAHEKKNKITTHTVTVHELLKKKKFKTIF